VFWQKKVDLFMDAKGSAPCTYLYSVTAHITGLTQHSLSGALRCGYKVVYFISFYTALVTTSREAYFFSNVNEVLWSGLRPRYTRHTSPDQGKCQPEVIRSETQCATTTHNKKVFAGRLNARGTRTCLPRRAGGAWPARRRRETLERRRRRSRAALLP
jgi:hypothetical protein